MREFINEINKVCETSQNFLDKRLPITKFPSGFKKSVQDLLLNFSRVDSVFEAAVRMIIS